MSAALNPARHTTRGRAAQRGMTMVELMVALLLGLVTTYFIAQVFAVAEGHKRTATFGTDAQINGAVGLNTLRRHALNAGYGITSVVETLGCPIYGQFGTAGSTTPAPAMVVAPLLITTSGVAAEPSDSVSILTSTKSTFAAPVRIKATHKAPDVTEPAAFKVIGSVGVKEDDVILAMPMAWDNNNQCHLFTVKSDTSSPDTTLSASTIPHVPAGSASSWNSAPNSAWPANKFVEGDVIVNFGKIRRMVFGVSGDTFQVVTWTQDGIGNAELLNSGVVLLKALYGRDTDGDGRVDTYDTTTPATNADWRRVLSVRMVMVARSGQREREIVTTAEPSWDVGGDVNVSYVKVPGGAATACAAGGGACKLPLPLSHLSDWQYYRYKVFDTAVPVRNLLWNLN
ncbi:MAG TPA: PilW family protein [Burkholderiaceae bacterium]|nr:PilW family protein [Burkholderiaceae bacterium]